MGIYGALSTAVTGLRSQSFALENISGNIANSQTIGFKRVDTDFHDLISSTSPKTQTSGSVVAQSRATNTLGGDVKTVQTATNMAAGKGFFVVEAALGQSDGVKIFGGNNYYTRRGDFDVDKDGYLVNGSGYYLKGLPIDRQTGNISTSLPEVVQISNAVLPAQPTTRISYQLNLPQLPKTAAYQQTNTKGSELMLPQDFMNIPVDTNAQTSGTTTTAGAAATTLASNGQTFKVTVGSTSLTFTFASTGTTSGTTISTADTNTDTVSEVLTQIQTELVNAGATNATVGLVGGKIVVNAGNLTDSVQIADTTTGMGFTNGTYPPTVALNTQLAARVTTIAANDSDQFVSESISGGAVTVYSPNGAPANVQLRWAKIASTDVGGVDRWQLFYMSDSTATGTSPKWTNVGTDYEFASNGAISPPITETALNNLTIDGVNMGDVALTFGQSGLTQFSDANGTAGVTTLKQNGYAAGKYVSVSINDSGRVVVAYDNGQQVEIAQVVTAQFNAANQLQRMDGGTFAATSESGEPVFDTSGDVQGSSLESSNTDISEEFTKLIVTQQAYSAGTRIVTTADQMLQDALNMVR